MKHLNNDEFFAVLYDLYFQKLYKIAYGYVSSKEDAEEIIQDVFVKLWEKRERIRSVGNITSYLYKMARNACLDFLRSKKHGLSIAIDLLQEQDLLNLYALSDDVSSAIIEKELQVQIEEGIKLLPERCKSVFIKSRLYGLKHKEIADSLDISTKTIENHITKALRILKKHLKHYF